MRLFMADGRVVGYLDYDFGGKVQVIGMAKVTKFVIP